MKLTAIEEMLRLEISAEELAKRLDTIIFDFTMVYGDTLYDGLDKQQFAGHIYYLYNLRDVLRRIES